ncbi:MAG: zinc ribbon domain-containing protein [Clostridiales bacterium]|nr:zinc ribbon domain-containing protein [Clostridiales bacterium]
MPLLQYRCPLCGKKFEELTRAEAPNPPCPDCGGETVRDYQGKVYTEAKKKTCTHNCATCSGCK